VATPREREGGDTLLEREMRGMEGGGGGAARLDVLRERVRPFIQSAAVWEMGVLGVLGVLGVFGVLGVLGVLGVFGVLGAGGLLVRVLLLVE
jgi:cell division protein FtsW (lipid II flippase)